MAHEWTCQDLMKQCTATATTRNASVLPVGWNRLSPQEPVKKGGFGTKDSPWGRSFVLCPACWAAIQEKLRLEKEASDRDIAAVRAARRKKEVRREVP
jgi:hypothetical protein